MKRVILLWVFLLLPLGLYAEEGGKPVTTTTRSAKAVTAAANSVQGVKPAVHQETMKKIADLEKKINELAKKVEELKGKSDHLVLGNLKLWGYLRMRYYDDLRRKYSGFSLEEMTVNLFYKPATYIKAWMNFWIHPNQIGFTPTSKSIIGCDIPTEGNYCIKESLYPSEMIGYLYIERAQAELTLPTLGPLTHSLRIGKWYRAAFGIPPAYPNRKISDYSLVSEAFTHDRVIGMDYMLSYNHMINFAASLYNGLAIGARSFGPYDRVEPKSVTIIADREIASVTGGKLAAVTDNDYNKEVSFKLGYQWPAGASYRKEYGGNGKYFQVDAFGTIGNRLTDADIGYLKKLNVPESLVPNRKKFRAGADLRLVLGRFSSDAEFFKGWTGGLQTIGYHILGVYKIFPGRVDFLARYAELDNLVDFSNGKYDSQTFSALWNKRQVQLSLKTYLAKWAWIQTEYYFNLEGPGTPKWNRVKNDVFFIEFVFFYM